MSPPQAATPAGPVAGDPAATAEYQKGLLQLLRGDQAGLNAMGRALARLERGDDARGEAAPDFANAAGAAPAPAGGHTLWWLARVLVEALAQGALPLTPELRRLCAGIERQIRRQPDRLGPSTEPMLRELLWHLMSAPGISPEIEKLRQLHALMAPPPTFYEPLAEEARAPLAALDRQLLVLEGAPGDEAVMVAALAALGDLGRRGGLAAVAALAAATETFLRWQLAEGTLRAPQSRALLGRAVEALENLISAAVAPVAAIPPWPAALLAALAAGQPGNSPETTQ